MHIATRILANGGSYEIKTTEEALACLDVLISCVRETRAELTGLGLIKEEELAAA